ncbi:hypothetical protein [Arthrobacter alpinus]|uniref:hypothetical protein n=1 Tax=Arthrobacter alpinus TaxID=656366 RepID=UPI0012FF5422|nr:hypothetical protein [Arthrobacter alpinus]
MSSNEDSQIRRNREERLEIFEALLSINHHGQEVFQAVTVGDEAEVLRQLASVLNCSTAVADGVLDMPLRQLTESRQKDISDYIAELRSQTP